MIGKYIRKPMKCSAVRLTEKTFTYILDIIERKKLEGFVNYKKGSFDPEHPEMNVLSISILTAYDDCLNVPFGWYLIKEPFGDMTVQPPHYFERNYKKLSDKKKLN